MSADFVRLPLPLDVRLVDPVEDDWATLSPFVYRTDIEPPNLGTLDRLLVKPCAGFPGRWEISVPVGQLTNWASIPRYLWSIIPSVGRWTAASLVHDFLYDYNVGSKEWADLVLRESSYEAGTGWQREALYWGVRLAGDTAWKAGRYRRTENLVYGSYPVYTPLPTTANVPKGPQ